MRVHRGVRVRKEPCFRYGPVVQRPSIRPCQGRDRRFESGRDRRSAHRRPSEHVGCRRRVGSGGRNVDKYMDQLMAPAFMKNPPLKLDIPAKTLGLIYAILGAIGVLFGLFGLFAALGLSAVATAVGIGGVWILLLIGGLVSEVGT